MVTIGHAADLQIVVILVDDRKTAVISYEMVLVPCEGTVEKAILKSRQTDILTHWATVWCSRPSVVLHCMESPARGSYRPPFPPSRHPSFLSGGF